MAKPTRELIVIQPNPNSAVEPLTYYDPELQNASNIEPADPERLQRALKRAKQLQRDYLESLKGLRARLGQRTYGKFATESDPLFDSNLLEFTFGDQLGFATSRRKARPRLSVRATFLSFERDKLHDLRYRNVESLRITVPTERWFDWGDGITELGSLLAHELIVSNDSLMSHKFLFVSGAVIFIAFGDVTWETRRAKR
jgi:hypothetical protein